MDSLEIIECAKQRPLSREEAHLLLVEEKPTPLFLSGLFAAACDVRRKEKGNEFVLDGFCGTVADCAIDPPCHYCARSAGKGFSPPLDLDEVRQAVRFIEQTGSWRMEIGAGTNPDEADRIIECARLAASTSRLRIWVNAGPSFSRSHLEQLKQAGIEEVGASLETINREVFARVKPGDSMDRRMELAREIKAVGLKLMSVMMVGLGSSPADYVEHIFWLKEVGVDHFAVTGLNPIPNTPLAGESPASPVDVFRVVAVARLVLRTPDISTGGMTNDPRLLPLQIMAGANRAIHLGAHVHRKRRVAAFRSWPVADEKESNGLAFSNLRPYSERVIRGMGLEPA